jgi:hypothetical protein
VPPGISAQVPSLRKNKLVCSISGAGTKPATPLDSAVAPTNNNLLKSVFTHYFCLAS